MRYALFLLVLPLLRAAPCLAERKLDRTVIIVSADQRDAANAAAVAIAGRNAADTFSVPVIKGNGKKVTHYIAAWQMDAKLQAAFEKAFATQISSQKCEVIKTQDARKTMTDKGAKPVKADDIEEEDKNPKK